MKQNIIHLEISKHALKRLDLIIGVEKAKREVRFMHQFLLSGRNPIAWHRGMATNDIPLFAEKCNSFDVTFLGFETHIESEYPLYVFCFEDFPAHGSEWYIQAIAELKSNNILDHIVPTIDVPEVILEKYLF